MRDGEREVLAHLALPLPMTVVAELSRAIDEAAQELGYTDVTVNTEKGWQISALPPGADLSSRDDTLLG